MHSDAATQGRGRAGGAVAVAGPWRWRGVRGCGGGAACQISLKASVIGLKSSAIAREYWLA